MFARWLAKLRLVANEILVFLRGAPHQYPWLLARPWAIGLRWNHWAKHVGSDDLHDAFQNREWLCELKNVENFDDRAVSIVSLIFFGVDSAATAANKSEPDLRSHSKSLMSLTLYHVPQWFFLAHRVPDSCICESLWVGKVPAQRTTAMAVARGTSQCLFGFCGVHVRFGWWALTGHGIFEGEAALRCIYHCFLSGLSFGSPLSDLCQYCSQYGAIWPSRARSCGCALLDSVSWLFHVWKVPAVIRSMPCPCGELVNMQVSCQRFYPWCRDHEIWWNMHASL